VRLVLESWTSAAAVEFVAAGAACSIECARAWQLRQGISVSSHESHATRCIIGCSQHGNRQTLSYTPFREQRMCSIQNYRREHALFLKVVQVFTAAVEMTPTS
jgi:hypothetical protein